MNFKKRALFQIQELVSELKENSENPKLIKKLNKIKSTIEKIRNPQTAKAIKKNKGKNNDNN